jgi:hypothetical protein
VFLYTKKNFILLEKKTKKNKSKIIYYDKHTRGYCRLKNVFKFSYKFVSIPVNGLIIETPGNSLRLLCDGFRWNLYKLDNQK